MTPAALSKSGLPQGALGGAALAGAKSILTKPYVRAVLRWTLAALLQHSNTVSDAKAYAAQIAAEYPEELELLNADAHAPTFACFLPLPAVLTRVYQSAYSMVLWIALLRQQSGFADSTADSGPESSVPDAVFCVPLSTINLALSSSNATPEPKKSMPSERKELERKESAHGDSKQLERKSSVVIGAPPIVEPPSVEDSATGPSSAQADTSGDVKARQLCAKAVLRAQFLLLLRSACGGTASTPSASSSLNRGGSEPKAQTANADALPPTSGPALSRSMSARPALSSTSAGAGDAPIRPSLLLRKSADIAIVQDLTVISPKGPSSLQRTASLHSAAAAIAAGKPLLPDASVRAF